MRGIIFILPVVLLVSSCTTYKAQKRAANQCEIDIDTYYLKELSLEQLECIEAKGQGDPDFKSLSDRIRAKKRELEKAKTEKDNQEKRLREDEAAASAET